MFTLLVCNKKVSKIAATLEQCRTNFSSKPKTQVLECRIDPNFKNYSVRIDGKLGGYLIPADNAETLKFYI